MPWDSPLGLLREELKQRRDEGCAIPKIIDAQMATLGPGDAWDEKRVGEIYDSLMVLPADAELAAREPNSLDAIRALRPDGPRSLGYAPSDDEALDRFHGAWTG